MKHLSEESLILLHYGEGEELDTDREHIDGCASCRDALEALRSDLKEVDALPVPERGADYGKQVYRRIQPELVGARSWSRYVGWGLAAAAAFAATFLAGRMSTEIQPVVASDQIRERILLVALDEHLDRSQMLLLEVSNREHGDAERDQARDLLVSSRLYRQSGRGVLDASATELLDELERLLLDVAHSSPSSASASLRERIDERDVLFKIQVLQTAVRERERQSKVREF